MTHRSEHSPLSRGSRPQLVRARRTSGRLQGLSLGARERRRRDPEDAPLWAERLQARRSARSDRRRSYSANIPTLDESVDVPGSLREFAEQEGLPESDVMMLARIEFRGEQPKTVDAWGFLYRAIKYSASE